MAGRFEDQETIRRPADWQLPSGVDRALWEYVHSDSVAFDYDAYFADHNLLNIDREFLEMHFVKPGRLVDLGCGTGRILVHFAARGFDVLGVDLSERMLAVAQQKSEEAGLPVKLLHANICDLGELTKESFEYAVCMFSTLGMVVGVDQRRKVLDGVHRLLSPGGLFGLHLHNWWYNLTDPQGRRWLLRDALKRFLRKEDAGDKVMSSYRGIPGLRLHIFTAAEIRREMKRAGFVEVSMVPLAPGRARAWEGSRLTANFHANGWLLMFRKA